MKRVLFVCIGNACRSQMAEAFARAYGSDVIIPASAGLSPAMAVAPDTMRAMEAKGLDLRDHFPKGLKHLGRAEFDLAINMSGFNLPEGIATKLEEWEVPDPVFLKYEEHCDIRDNVERRVMELILKLRKEGQAPHFRGGGSGHLPV